MNIVWTQTGVVQIKITTFGKAEAAWGTKRAAYPMEKVNAIVKMTRIIGLLEQWGAEFEEKYIYQSPTGPLLPKVNIGGIEGGAPYRPNYFPGVCSIYVDIRMPPQVRPVAIKHELEQVLDRGGVEYEMDIYKSLLGHEAGMSSLWCTARRLPTSTFSARRSNRSRRTAPASGPTPTSTMNSAFRRSRSARAAAASVRATRRSTSTK